MAISSKNRGKSGGARVITYVRVESERLYLVSIYDKSDRNSISEIEVREMIEKIE